MKNRISRTSREERLLQSSTKFIADCCVDEAEALALSFGILSHFYGQWNQHINGSQKSLEGFMIDLEALIDEWISDNQKGEE